MASIGHDADVPLGITSHLPIGEDRASELARVIAASLNDVRGVQALCELLLGIAPQSSFANLNEVSKRRLRDRTLMFDTGEVSDLLGDLWTRYCAATHALDALFSFTPEFERAFREYTSSLHQTAGEQGGEA